MAHLYGLLYTMLHMHGVRVCLCARARHAAGCCDAVDGGSYQSRRLTMYKVQVLCLTRNYLTTSLSQY